MFNTGGNNNPNGSPLSGGFGGGFWWAVAAPQSRTAVAVTALAGIAVFAAIFYTTSRGHLKSPWSGRKRKHTLSSEQWKSMFTPDGKLIDGGASFLKKVRSGGVDPSIRAEVWPFLLGVYDLNSSKEERDNIRSQKRKEYEKLRRQCSQLLKSSNESLKLNDSGEKSNGDSKSLVQETCASGYDDVSAKESLSSENKSEDVEHSHNPSSTLLEGDDNSGQQVTSSGASAPNTQSSDSDSEVINSASSSEGREENDPGVPSKEDISRSTNLQSNRHATENFITWQRIIRVDAVRANSEWIPYSPSQASVSKDGAYRSAETVGLKDYDHLEPCRIFHAARLVAILEAYALYDPEIGYCQGMSDLLSPIIAVMTEDHEAFWCFVGFMKKARHNFRLDEVGIRRQLNIVSKIIKCKDSRLYSHLEKLQAEDCFFVYRMVVVLFRRELTFEQTICLWEVMWADQAAIRARIGKSAWSRIRELAPPTDDLLLYAIAASVLQRRKLIIQKYYSMDEILRECNSMAGQLDVWKLLDDAHDLVVNLHGKIESSF
ncbi:rab GTPase-activating protein 22 [Ricinus communis]|uniref:rab GTPase-activating protein 22 n=1 Tax=Ricinus communis TaxID=3988 RepID=UPI00201B1643|nr:rab GTPase-activating protein 22 [Ricinus communis]